jgi:hypothetical protein
MSDDLNEIRARADAATPGPWDFEWSDENIQVNAGTARTEWTERGTGFPAMRWATTDRIVEFDVDDLEEPEEQTRANDAEFIAHAREDIPRLLDLIVEQRATIARLEAELARINGQTINLSYGPYADMKAERDALTKAVEALPHTDECHGFINGNYECTCPKSRVPELDERKNDE